MVRHYTWWRVVRILYFNFLPFAVGSVLRFHLSVVGLDSYENGDVLSPTSEKVGYVPQ